MGSWQGPFDFIRPTFELAVTAIPQIDRITSKKLEVMDEFILQKSILAKRRKEHNVYQEAGTPVVEEEQDVMNVKALPLPEGFAATAKEEKKEKEKEEEEEEKKKKKKNVNIRLKQEEEEKPAPAQGGRDMLNLHQDAITTQEHDDKLELVLFDRKPQVQPHKWEAFKDDPADWPDPSSPAAGDGETAVADP